MTVSASQWILGAALVGLAVYVFRLRSTTADRLIYAVLAFVGLVFVAWPDLSTRLAHAVGIGRGTDLVLYVFALFSLFHFVTLESRLKSLEGKLTRVAREAALSSPRSGPEPARDPEEP
jgi:hypothetical protein